MQSKERWLSRWTGIPALPTLAMQSLVNLSSGSPACVDGYQTNLLPKIFIQDKYNNKPTLSSWPHAWDIQQGHHRGICFSLTY